MIKTALFKLSLDDTNKIIVCDEIKEIWFRKFKIKFEKG